MSDAEEIARFPLPIPTRIVYVVIGAFLCATAALIPLGLWYFVDALFGGVVVYADRIVKRPFGGSVYFAEVRRWGTGRQHFRRDPKQMGQVTHRDWVAVQRRSGRTMWVNTDIYHMGGDLPSLLHDRIEAPHVPLVGHWLWGLVFVEEKRG